MTKRIKAITEIRSREEFDRVVNEVVDKQIVKEKLELRRDSKILAIRQEMEPGINDLGDAIQVGVIRAEKYADDHREELLPGKKKTSETALAFFGFRTGNPTLLLLNRKWTWAKVIEAIKRVHENWRDYIVVKESVDKDKMKQANAEQLAEVGLRVDQKEIFFIDPKRDPADPQRLVSPEQKAA